MLKNPKNDDKSQLTHSQEYSIDEHQMEFDGTFNVTGFN
jgi:hypothetical protein